MSSFLHGRQSSLRGQKWLDVPNHFPCTPDWQIFDGVLEMITVLSETVRRIESQKHIPAISDRENEIELELVVQRLEQLWEMFEHNHGFDVLAHPLFVTTSTMPPIPKPHESPISILPKAIRWGLPSLTTAYFHAAAILVADIRKESAAIINIHSIHVLASALLMEKCGVGCACSRMMLPMAVIEKFTQDAQTRRQAEILYRRWCNCDGLPGLADIVFNRKLDLPVINEYSKAVECAA